MPTHMPVLIDFWAIDDNPKLDVLGVWAMLCAAFNKSIEGTTEIVVPRADDTVRLKLDVGAGRITQEFIATTMT